jgi:hypothetical protein
MSLVTMGTNIRWKMSGNVNSSADRKFLTEYLRKKLSCDLAGNFCHLIY